MHLTIRQIEIFKQCAIDLHFSNSANKLHMTPAAITKQINNLETQLGCKLFQVIGKKVHLTAQGQTILPYINKITTALTDFKDALNYNLVHASKPIRIALGAGLENIIFKHIHQFKQEHQTIDFKLAISKTHQEQIDCLLTNKIDLYFATKLRKNKYLQQTQIFTLKYYLTCAQDNPLASRARKATQLRQQTFITTNIEKSEAKIYDKSLLLDSFPSVKEAVLASLGIGLLPENLVLDDNRLHRLYKKPILIKPVYLVTLKSGRNNELDLFTKFCLQQRN